MTDDSWSNLPKIPFRYGVYILVDKTPVAAGDDLLTFIRWRHEHPELYQIALDQIGNAEVSTIFLGYDHSYGRGRAPVLFETMVFGGPLDMGQRRYYSYDEAERGHTEAVAEVRAAMDKINEIATAAGATKEK